MNTADSNTEENTKARGSVLPISVGLMGLAVVLYLFTGFSIPTLLAGFFSVAAFFMVPGTEAADDIGLGESMESSELSEDVCADDFDNMTGIDHSKPSFLMHHNFGTDPSDPFH